MRQIEYEPYHVHEMISNCLTQPDSTVSIKDYAEVFKQRGHQTLCILEHGNRSNVWAQFDEAQRLSDDTYHITPIAAAEAYFVPNRNPELKDDRNYHLVLVAKNQEGLYQLNMAMSEANLTGYYRHARVDWDILSRLDYRNFLVTTACVAGPVRDENAEQYLNQLKAMFRENFYLEVQPHPQKIQVEHNKRVLEFYRKLKIPLIFATDSHYIYPQDAIIRRELMLSKGISYGSEDEFLLDLPTAEDAYQRMLDQGVLSRAQIEEAFENTLQLREFEGVHFDRERKFPVSRPDLTLKERENLYKRMVCEGYIAREGMPTKAEAAEIHKEMDVIVDTHSCDYFIGLHDMVELGQKYGGVLTTTSRGSACGFVSNFALGFTSVNRLHAPVKMYPERFISKDKLKAGLPDEQLRRHAQECA